MRDTYTLEDITKLAMYYSPLFKALKRIYSDKKTQYMAPESYRQELFHSLVAGTLGDALARFEEWQKGNIHSDWLYPLNRAFEYHHADQLRKEKQGDRYKSIEELAGVEK